MTSDRTATRRRYSQEFKAQVISECAVPGASVAKVAMSHGINTNIVHGWRKLGREGAAAVEVRGLPEGAVFSPDGKWLYIGNFMDSDISVLRVDGDTVTNTGTLVKLSGKPASMRGRTQ